MCRFVCFSNIELCSGVISDLHQKAFNLQKSLEITQKAREDDHQDLQTQLHERDRLLLNANAENDRLHTDKSRLETLIQVRACLRLLLY